MQEINETVACGCVKFGIRTEYAIEYLEQIAEQYAHLFELHPEKIVRGRGHHKSAEQRNYDKLVEYTNKLKKYAEHIKICGEERNSYSKTDTDATFMRMKKDYKKNETLAHKYVCANVIQPTREHIISDE